ncbi:MAG: ethanolamine utilization protein EutN [Oscillospiraceae bacterium]|nr:ethanolamine utilization protein EutN [Oscillospiraceae bacterium]MCR4751619.1 ethanolamine utilization protein EutN [Eubacterium sp.]
MYTGIVEGKVISTIKEENLMNIPLLIVRKIEDGKKKGLVVAADSTRMAGEGDYVYMIGSKEAARIFRKTYTPADVAIVGFIDSYREEL